MLYSLGECIYSRLDGVVSSEGARRPVLMGVVSSEGARRPVLMEGAFRAASDVQPMQAAMAVLDRTRAGALASRPEAVWIHIEKRVVYTYIYIYTYIHTCARARVCVCVCVCE